MGQVTQAIFNTPIEVGLRLLFVINRSLKSLDTQRLIYYNYILVHSSDIPSAPKSLHPDFPNRSCEIYVTRKIIQKGLLLLVKKGLVEIVYTKKGILYKSNKMSDAFLTQFKSAYASELAERASWVSEHFDYFSDKQLADFINDNVGKWGSEFTKQYTDDDK